MYAVIKFDNAAHKDNEQTETFGPFGSMDSADRWARANATYWHIVPIQQPQKRDFTITKREA